MASHSVQEVQGPGRENLAEKAIGLNHELFDFCFNCSIYWARYARPDLVIYINSSTCIVP